MLSLKRSKSVLIFLYILFSQQVQSGTTTSCFDELHSRKVFSTTRIQAEKLVDALSKLRKPVDDPKVEAKIREGLIEKMGSTMATGKPIRMYIPCFPAKSPNHAKKTLSPHADLAEEIAIQRLSEVIEEMNQIYPSELLIASDGRMFSDTWWSTEEKTDMYRQELISLIKTPHIRVADLDLYYPGLTPQQAREKVLTEFGPTPEEIDAGIRSDDTRKNLYLAFTRFIQDDTPPDDPALVGLSGKKQKELFKERAREDMRRSDALNNMLIQRLMNEQGYIRLSIREQQDTPEKIGINLLEGEGQEFTGSPWHNVIALKDDGSYYVLKREEAEARGYELIYKDGKPHHFRVPNN